MNEASTHQSNHDRLIDQLIEKVNPMIAPLGYEVVHLETHVYRQKILRLFIDHLSTKGPRIGPKKIGIEDCVKVTKALDEPLDQLPEIENIFKGPYELEVSSPGADRPLRRADDYARFKGRKARIHVYRPLTAEELSNSQYQQSNPKQKNFLGQLVGLKDDRVMLVVGATDVNSDRKPGKKRKAQKAAPVQTGDEVTIPLPLISKANLEPVVNLEDLDSDSFSSERESN